MKNVITHIKAERAKRPREQHVKIDSRKVDELLAGIEAQQLDQFKLENEKRKLEADNAALSETVARLKKLAAA